MNLTNSIDDGNVKFSGKPTTWKVPDTIKSAIPPRDAGVNAEPDKKKSTSGKTGLLTTTIYPTTKDIGEYRHRPLHESPRLNKIALQKILTKLSLNNGPSVLCPKCSKEWNRLTPNGICYDCDPVEQADRKKWGL